MTTDRISIAQFRRARQGSAEQHASLQQACLVWLRRVRRVPAVPIETAGKVYRRRDGSLALGRNVDQRGVSDILAVLPPSGRAVFIECKTGRASRSPDQVRRQAEFSTAGALCLVVRDVRDLERALQGVE